MVAPHPRGASVPAAEAAQTATALSPGQRLWTPWRMRYVGGHAKEEGCPFCNRLAGSDDVRALILDRGERAFAIMNLFPYNTGHLMLVPNDHVAAPDEADPAALAEMATLLVPVTRALRRALRCEGFNVGMNVGAVAGAGVADHLHQHVVPRWVGDANFMPILASTMVLPELIPVTYAKLRAELARELRPEAAKRSTAQVRVVLLSRDDSHLLVVRAGDGWRLPAATAAPDEAIWRAAAGAIANVPGGVELAGWAGETRATADDPIGLTFRVLDPEAAAANSGSSDQRFSAIGGALSLADAGDRRAVEHALANLEPGIERP